MSLRGSFGSFSLFIASYGQGKWDENDRKIAASTQKAPTARLMENFGLSGLDGDTHAVHRKCCYGSVPGKRTMGVPYERSSYWLDVLIANQLAHANANANTGIKIL